MVWVMIAPPSRGDGGRVSNEPGHPLVGKNMESRVLEIDFKDKIFKVIRME